MKSTFKILLALSILLLLASQVTSQTVNCNTASSAQCGKGLCSRYAFIGSACLLQSAACSSAQAFSNATDSCTDCQTLNSASCTSTCGNFNFFTNTLTTYTQAGTLNGCRSCQDAFGLGCISCNTTNCVTCNSLATLNSSTNNCRGTLCSALTNCIICVAQNECKLCLQGFDLNLVTFNCESSTCKIKHCLRCSSTLCSDCYTGYKLSTSREACQPLCLDVNCNNCIAPGICGGCILGYILNVQTSTCVLNCQSNAVSNCFACKNLNVCDSCIPGYHLAFKGTKCYVDCIDTNCQICEGTVCKLCSEGFKTENGGTCIQDICTIKHCNNCSSVNTCGTCITNFATNTGSTLCEPACTISASLVTNCIICASAFSCDTCNPGYRLVNAANNTKACELLCQIANCQVCAGQTTCSACLNTYELSADATSCKLQCITNCDACVTTTQCQTCAAGFRINSDNTSCIQSCQTGQIIVGQTCASCSANDLFCLRCIQNSGSTRCTTCKEGYFIDSAFKCALCSTRIPNCILCEGSVSLTCTQCLAPTKLSQGRCIQCNLVNCQSCVATDNTKCAVCGPGFDSINGLCTLRVVACPATTILINGQCSCTIGAYLSGSTCISCTTNCVNCTSSLCSNCISGYFPLGTACNACQTNCISCSSLSNCLQCSDTTSLVDGNCANLGDTKGVVRGTTVISCSVGCKSCTLGTDDIVICTTAEDSYANVNGVPVKCDSSCRGCSTGNPLFCRSCFTGFALENGQTCVICSDRNALTCAPTNKVFSLTCQSGYTTRATPGVCARCTSNCLKCDMSELGKCDLGGCETGYIVDETSKCVNCFNNCPFCDPNDPRMCLRCDVGRYLSNFICLQCATNCIVCTNATVCTQCSAGFVLINSICYAAPVFPCAGFNDNIQCKSCFNGYNLVGFNCVFDASCNATRTCSSCNNGFYLDNRQCLACSLPTGCRTCLGTTVNNCQRCSHGFYLDNGLCVVCSTGCTKCQNKNTCIEAGDGYYIELNQKREPTGIIFLCTSPCRNCVNYETYCLDCVPDFIINGATCFSSKLVAVNVVYNPTGDNAIFAADDTNQVKLRKAFRNLYTIKKQICASLPEALRAGDDEICSRTLVITGLSIGSLNVNFKVDTNTQASSSGASASILSAINSNGIGGSTVNIVSSSTEGYTVPAIGGQDKLNLGLILGVAIPLGLLFILIVVFTMCYRGEEQQFDKEIDYEQIGHQQNNFENI